MDYFIPAVVSTVLLVTAVYFLVRTRMDKNRMEQYYKELLETKDKSRKELSNRYEIRIDELRAEYSTRVAIVRVGDREVLPNPTDNDLAFVEKELTRKGFDPEKVLVVPWHLTFDSLSAPASARKNP